MRSGGKYAGGKFAGGRFAGGKFGAVVSYAAKLAQLQSMLAPTKGAFCDWRFPPSIYEDAGTDLAELTDPIYQTNARQVGTATPMNWEQVTLGSRPIFQAGYAAFDGVAQHFNGSANVLAVYQQVGAAMMAVRAEVTSLAADSHVIRFSNGLAAGTVRYGLEVLTTGALRLTVRRLDADGSTQGTSTTGLITAGVPFNFIGAVDYTNGGAGAIKGYLNGTEVISTALAGTGSTENTATLQARIGRNNATSYMPGEIVSVILANMLPTAAQRTLINDILTGA